MSAELRQLRLSPADWDAWYQTGHPTVVSHKEADRFHQRIAPKPGLNAVDLACGCGQWTRQLAAWGLTVRGYDFSPEALRQAAAAGLRDELAYEQWDIDGEPIPRDLLPGSVGLVTCRYALPYLQYARLLTDVGRWLTSDGTFYALVRVDRTEAAADEDPAANDQQDTAPDPYHRGFTEQQIETLGYGWAHCQTYSLSRRHRAIVLRGYGRTTAPEPGKRPRKRRPAPGAGAPAPSLTSHALTPAPPRPRRPRPPGRTPGSRSRNPCVSPPLARVPPQGTVRVEPPTRQSPLLPAAADINGALPPGVEARPQNTAVDGGSAPGRLGTADDRP